MVLCFINSRNDECINFGKEGLFLNEEKRALHFLNLFMPDIIERVFKDNELHVDSESSGFYLLRY